MATHTDTVLLVIGSGPGIGRATASIFASKRIGKIGLVARNQEQLLSDKKAIEESAQKANRVVEVKTWAVDITNTPEFKKVLSEVEKLGTLEVIFFNAARVLPSKLLEHPAKDMEYDFKISVTALYETAIWAIPNFEQMQDKNISPSLFVTNSLLYAYPMAELFALSTTKAAQRTLVQCLAQQYGKSVHVALVTVGGAVSEDADKLNPTHIASKVWELFEQPKSEWKEETVIVEED